MQEQLTNFGAKLGRLAVALFV